MIDAGLLKDKIAALGLSVSASQLDQLIRYAGLLLKWNKVYNLTRITREEDLVNLHLIDSLTLVKAVRDNGLPVKRLLDVGSGGGLPAIPFAVMNPGIQVTMVDAVKKKAMFLTQAGVELGLKNTRAVHTRIEQFQAPGFDAISSRAFASLGDMCRWTQHLLAPDGLWLAMKGKIPQDEISALPEGVSVLGIHKLTVPGTDLERHLIVLKREADG